MLEYILSGLAILFHLDALFFLIAGLLAGFLVGALPGFTSSNAAAVLLPLTIPMTTEGALIFISSLYAGASFAGSIPAILINAPGTAGAAATCLDGYPMAQQGKGEMAIGIARMASVSGGVIATVIVIFIMNPISKFAIKFGPPEMCLLALFGLIIIGGVLGKDIKKGMIAAGVGLLIASMSADPIMGKARFTFGFIELYEKVPFVPAIIGLFAVTEMFFLANKSRISQTIDREKHSFFSVKETLDGIKITLKYPIAIFRACTIGMILGIIPGLGQAVANFISYAEAKRWSKKPERFGTGIPEGIIASEACDNGSVAGTLVPTLALGIPGSETAAIMLVALYLHGVRPGPQVLLTHAAEIYAVLLSLFFSNLLILPLGILLVIPLVRVTRTPNYYLVPIVLVLGSIGSFAVSNSVFDVTLMFVFALIGILMRTYDFPIVPIILGLILGPIAEANFVRSYLLSRGDISIFFDSPISKGLWIILISIFLIRFIKIHTAKRK